MNTPLARLALLLSSCMTLALVAGACADTGPPPAAPLDMRVAALSCGDAAADPFADIDQVTVVVTGLDPESGEPFRLEEKRTLAGKESITIGDVLEGSGHTIELFGFGAESDWYAKDPSVKVIRNETNDVDLLMTRYGDFTCVDHSALSYTNAVFPAMVELGDGRIMISGGFTEAAQDTGSGKSFLIGPRRDVLIFDPATGAIRAATEEMSEDEARAGHSMVFIPSVDGTDEGKVLFIGGFNELEYNPGSDFFFRLGSTKGDVRNDYLLFDIATETFVEKVQSATTPMEQVMSQKRGFPRAALMADLTVVITGGGSWPDEDNEAYKEVEIFDPLANDGSGGFLPIQSFESEHVRTGHSLSFIKNDDNGLSLYLAYGGTTRLDTLAEVLKQSSRQRDGVDGSFVPVTVYGESSAAFRPYFHEMTPLAGQRFLLTGGARYDDGDLDSPKDGEAWLLTYSDNPTPQIQIEKVEGFGAGRVFHTAVTDDFRNVTVLGGFDGGSAVETENVMFFDLDDRSWTTAPEQGSFKRRGGGAGVMMSSGSLLLAGGETNIEGFGNALEKLVIEVYTPSSIEQPE